MRDLPQAQNETILKAGAVESIMSFPFDRTNHYIEIKGGMLAKECGQILKDFFEDKREMI